MPTQSIEQKLIKEFREKFVLNPNEIFFGKKEELEKEGWQVGESRLIIKQDIEPKDLEQFLISTIEQIRKMAYEEGRKEALNEIADIWNKRDPNEPFTTNAILLELNVRLEELEEKYAATII